MPADSLSIGTQQLDNPVGQRADLVFTAALFFSMYGTQLNYPSPSLPLSLLSPSSFQAFIYVPFRGNIIYLKILNQ